MNKHDFTVRLSEELDETQVATKTILETTLQTIADVLAEGDSVEIMGFGKFVVVGREARKGRNPKTGEEIDIPAKNAIKFVPASALKDAVNE